MPILNCTSRSCIQSASLHACSVAGISGLAVPACGTTRSPVHNHQHATLHQSSMYTETRTTSRRCAAVQTAVLLLWQVSELSHKDLLSALSILCDHVHAAQQLGPPVLQFHHLVPCVVQTTPQVQRLTPAGTHRNPARCEFPGSGVVTTHRTPGRS